MMDKSSSSGKVSYDLRPKKQVERRMMIHIIRLLAEAGFLISTYRYVGFGAFFFVDFILFRKVLGIKDMKSLEHDKSNQNRVLFNCPYNDIDVEFGSASDYIASIDNDTPHILWLDYDGPVEDEFLLDIETAAHSMCSGSILIATFDVDFNKADIDIRDVTPSKRPQKWLHRFEEQCGNFFDPSWTISDFTGTKIHKRTAEVTKYAIESGLEGREGINFNPLFNFLYADGHYMLTIGGIICSKQDQRKLKQIEWDSIPFVRKNLSNDPFEINVPVLTKKERLYIDSYMPCEDDWTPIDFEIKTEDLQEYRKIYDYCPLYGELLL